MASKFGSGFAKTIAHLCEGERGKKAVQIEQCNVHVPGWHLMSFGCNKNGYLI